METTEDLYAQIARLREVLKSAEQVADQRGKELLELREKHAELKERYEQTLAGKPTIPGKGQI